MIAEIEDAIIARLKNQLTYLRKCDSIAEFLTYDLDKLTRLTPAVYVAYEGGPVEQLVSGVEDHRINLSVIVLTRNMRGDVAARHGVAGEKGAYEVAEDVWSALSNNACGASMDPLLLSEIVPLQGSKKLAMYGLRFRTRTRRSQ